QINGKEIRVHNSARVPARFNLQVLIGRNKNLQKTWQIIAVRETYDEPAGGGEIGYHHEQHEFVDGEPGPDTVWIDKKQILKLSVLVTDAENFIVTVFGDVIETSSGTAQVNTQTMDLSSYLPTAGAKIIKIQTDDDGVLSVVGGDEYESPLAGAFGNIPPTDPDKHTVCCIVLHEAMEELSNKDIFIPHLFHGGGITFVTWGNVEGDITDQADLMELLDAKMDADSFPQILMEDGVTFPPVPLTNEDGTDWIYDN
ncbi:MAG: hypothetical protein L0287_24320, partial [Anaerolineae bacterium]|nr:hypothetical protein [Anaerolineae bacterium]